MADTHAPSYRSCLFRYYGQLNDFLPRWRRQRAGDYLFTGSVGLRDAIQAQGVPHSEVDLVLVDGVARAFDFRLLGGELISVYPRFRAFDPDPGERAGPPLPVLIRFILDVHLGKLCRHLRLLGFDTLWRNDFEDSYIIDRSLADDRIILTRDLGILKQGRVQHGYYVRSTNPGRQIEEVLEVFNLMDRCDPLSRCIRCNGEVIRVTKAAVEQQLPPGTRRSYDRFYQCRECRQVYWRGAHYVGLMGKLASYLEGAGRLGFGKRPAVPVGDKKY